jgi:UDP-3-O-[3-hydroxymyristoyl] glucosamine N-acyltransferase
MVTGQEIEGGRDYGGLPAKPVRDWMRELYAMATLTKRPKRGKDG